MASCHYLTWFHSQECTENRGKWITGLRKPNRQLVITRLPVHIFLLQLLCKSIRLKYALVQGQICILYLHEGLICNLCL